MDRGGLLGVPHNQADVSGLFLALRLYSANDFTKRSVPRVLNISTSFDSASASVVLLLTFSGVLT